MVRTILALCLVFLSSCATFRGISREASEQGVKVAPLPNAKKIEITIKRETLIASLKNGAVNRVRVIPTYSRSSEQSNSYPRYRLFDVEPTGPYHLLGLRDADILIAAHDYVVFDPRSFPAYVTLLTNEERTALQVVRNNEALIINVKIQ